MSQCPQGARCLVSKMTLAHKGMKGNYVSESPGLSIRTRFQQAGLCGMLNHRSESSPFQGIAGAQLGRSSELLGGSVFAGRLVKCPYTFQGDGNHDLTPGSCPLLSSLFRRDGTGWSPLWRKKWGIRKVKCRGEGVLGGQGSHRPAQED